MNTTEIKVDAVAAEHPAVRVVVEQAAERLAAILAESPDPVTSEWSGYYDPKSRQPMVTVRLSGAKSTSRPSRIFTLDELTDREFSDIAFRLLFSAYLRGVSEAILTRMFAASE